MRTPQRTMANLPMPQSSSESKRSGSGSDATARYGRQVIQMALRDQPYIPLYVMDFATDEKLANCSAESTGVYIRLMCILHKMEEYGVIELKAKEKKDESNIRNFAAKLVRQMPYDVACIERSLRELIDEGVVTLEGDRLYQKRMVKDGDISLKRAKAGSKGGKTTKGNADDEEDKQNSKQNASKPSSKNEANSENEVEIENEDVSEDTEKVDLVAERFKVFWKAYPRKSGKGGAEKAWKKIAPSQKLFDEIMAALDAAKKCDQWKKDNGQFIPYPATWLNQKRWEDEYGVPKVETRTNFDPDNPYADWGEGK